jgi:hypothetical protein
VKASSATAPEAPAPLPPTIAVKSVSAPLWQWIAVGVGGVLAAVLAARSASTLDDTKPVTAKTAATVTSVPSVAVTPHAAPGAGGPRANQGLTAPVLTVNAGPLTAGTGGTVDAPRDAGKLGTSSVKRGKNSYATEALALDATRDALDRKDTAKASAILDQYDRDWPSGFLGPDALALRIELMALDKQDQPALALATKFLADYPHSPHAGAVRSIADQLRARGAK